MVGSSRQSLPSWMGVATATRKVELDKNMVKEGCLSKEPSKSQSSDVDLSLWERAFSAGGAAFISAVIVNPLDVAKVLFLDSCCVGSYGFGSYGCAYLQFNCFREFNCKIE